MTTAVLLDDLDFGGFEVGADHFSILVWLSQFAM